MQYLYLWKLNRETGRNIKQGKICGTRAKIGSGGSWRWPTRVKKKNNGSTFLPCQHGGKHKTNPKNSNSSRLFLPTS